MSYDPEDPGMTEREEELSKLCEERTFAWITGDNKRYNELWDQIRALDKQEEPDL